MSNFKSYITDNMALIELFSLIEKESLFKNFFNKLLILFSQENSLLYFNKKYKTISYDSMLKKAEDGAKVLHDKCVKIGRQFKVPMYVKSTFEKLSKGTLVTDIEDCFY